VLPGDSLIVHASLRTVGRVEGGADAVIDALLETVGPEGTIVAPTFSNLRFSADSVEPDPSNCIASEVVGVLPERLMRRPDAYRSRHRAFSFTALGSNAEFITAEAPFHYPMGTNSPLARLFQLNGGVLLLGVGHEANSAIYLAEAWANVPYLNRRTLAPNDQNEWQEMLGSPGCTRGFARIEPVLRQARILREGYVGNAPSEYMRIQHTASMAVEMLKGDPESLLCDDPGCESCTLARKLTAEQKPLGRR
jgi:aminoglycoside 3-N-acetyltransferase